MQESVYLLIAMLRRTKMASRIRSLFNLFEWNNAFLYIQWAQYSQSFRALSFKVPKQMRKPIKII